MNPSQSTLTVLLWNANALRNHILELETYLHFNKIDLALVSETHFTSRSHFYITGYTTYRTDHPDDTAHGGTAVLVRDSLTHQFLPSVPSDSLMSTSVKIHSSHFDFTVAAVYCPPNKRLTSQDFLSYFQSLGPRFLSGGDYNAKNLAWGCRASNPRGTVLHNTLSTFPHSIHTPGQPTYWPISTRKRPDLLDFFISYNLAPLRGTTSMVNDMSSDHSPVLLLLDTRPIPKPVRPTLMNGPIDWDGFREEVERRIDLKIPLKTSTDVDNAAHSFTTLIQSAIHNNTGTLYNKNIKFEGLYLPLEIRQLLRRKRKARKAWQARNYPSNRRTYDFFTNRLKQALHEYRTTRHQAFTQNLTQNDKSLWRATRRILSHKSCSLPLLQEDGTWTKTKKEKANTFATFLHTLFTPHDSENHDLNFDSKINLDLSSPLQLSLPPKHFSPSEVTATIQNLPIRKAPGYDLITAEILKKLPKKAFIFLTYIYNSVLRTTYFPLIWKFSTIKMILKPSKPSEASSSYRPISLLPTLGKVLEKLLLRRLYPIIDSREMIPDHQFGFRSQHSTIQQCHRVVDTIASTLERKQYCSAAFLDEAQAFDRVWHVGLLWKLKKILPSTYFLIINSYLTERYFQVSEGCFFSSYFPVRAGVPQGSILAPLLYTVYTADIPRHPHTLLASYADDKAILSSHQDPTTASQHLQEHLSSVEKWVAKWRIKINPQKSQHVIFTLNKSFCPPVFLNRIPLPTADVVKYLGLYIDKRLTWNPHTRLKRQETNTRYRTLLRILDNRSRLPLENKLLLYNTLLKPMWAYGVELWGSAKPSNISKIQSLQSKILRKIISAPFYVTNKTIHSDLKVPFVREYAIDRYRRFHEKLDHHPNPLARNLQSLHIPDNPLRRLNRQWPRDLLLQ